MSSILRYTTQYIDAQGMRAHAEEACACWAQIFYGAGSRVGLGGVQGW